MIFGKDVWWLILNLCKPNQLCALSITCKKMKGWCDEERRWRKFVEKSQFKLQEFDLKEKVQRIERIGGHLLALTESFELKDVCSGAVLLEGVRDFACGRKKVAVCRQVKTEFCFEQYAWPLFEKPQATSTCFKSVAEHLCLCSNRLAGCRNKTQVVLWEFELPDVVCCDKLDGIVTGMTFTSKGKLVAREGFVQPQYRRWQGKTWSTGFVTYLDPTSDLWCSYGEDTVVATDESLLLVKAKKKQPKIGPLQPKKKRRKKGLLKPEKGALKNELLKLAHLERIFGVKSLYGGRAFITLHDCGQLILRLSPTEKKVLCKPDPNFRFVADQLTVGTDAQGHPVIAYVMNNKTVRIFSKGQYVDK